jgi:hypothetical protein
LCKLISGQDNLSGFGVIPTPSTHTIAILPSALKGFEPKTIIGAYDQAGNCFGATVYDSETIGLTAFGDDPTTTEKDGFNEGEVIVFKNLSGLEDLSGLIPTFDPQLPSADGHFTENGLSAITDFKEATGIFERSFSHAVSIYPNPAKGKVTIAGLIAGAEISLSDLHGQTIANFKDQSEQADYDLTGLPPGVYLVKIKINDQSIFRKLILQ